VEGNEEVEERQEEEVEGNEGKD
jgi:hypothetical protein